MGLIFKYHARDIRGDSRDGEIEALNEDDAVKKLQEQGLIIVSLEGIEREKKEKEIIDQSAGILEEKNTKKCPFCAEGIPLEAIKCNYCGGALDKYKDWDKLPDKKQPEKWYFKTSLLVTAFLSIGPFALPLLWFNPRYSQKTKIIASAIIIILSWFLGVSLSNSMKSIGKYYQQINQLNL
jgi:hypothetical protein